MIHPHDSALHFFRRRSNATGAFKQFLARIHADGVPSTVEVAQSDSRGELS